MKACTFIDAAAHVEECDDPWNFLDREYQPRRPVAMTVERQKAPSRGNLNAFWLIDGRVSSLRPSISESFKALMTRS